MQTKFTINDNEKIRKYLEGSDEDIPISELIYLHTHPLVRPSFLTEIETLVNQAAEVIEAKKIQGRPVEEFIRLAVTIGQTLPEINQTNAPVILNAIRELYKLCNLVIRMK